MLEALCGLLGVSALGALSVLAILFVMMGLTSTIYNKQHTLSSLTAAMALYDGAKIGLIAAPFTETENLTYADVTAGAFLPTFGGYAPIAVAAWSAPFLDVDGEMKVDGGDILFQPNADGSTDIIYGWYAITAAGNHLLGTGTFPTPIPVPLAINGVQVEVELPYGW